ncbi:pre-coat protein [Chilli leaf curl Gonda virus]|uniref:Protein V2 n=1 Tax=Chilli leaf curl Gonda virus TaxID=2560380 RepID=A0A088MQ03_9GEMI|nr:pre-coat protein [Chilli leaf curl Gonda virus]AIN41794.1 pre-coat protein [Chilli leaf curl Gonda virus]
MRDPLLNHLPETVHGLTCLLPVLYLYTVEITLSPDTLKYDLIRDLISVIRARKYVEATSRYNHFHSRLEGKPQFQLCQPIYQPCCCPHCPRHQSKSMGQQAHEQEAQDVQDVQKPRCSEGL